MNVLDAAYMAAHEYPGGVPALAGRMTTVNKTVNQSVLSHQLNPNDLANPLTVINLNKLITLTGNYGPLHALCLEHNHMAIPLPSVADAPTTEAIANTCKEFADYLQSITTTLANGKVTQLELRTVRKEMGEMVSAAGILDAILTAMESKGARHE